MQCSMKGSLSMSRGSLRPSSTRIHSILVLSSVIALGVMTIKFYSNTVQFNVVVERAEELERAAKTGATTLLSCERHLEESHKKLDSVKNKLAEVTVSHTKCQATSESWHEQVETLLADMRQQAAIHEQRIEEYKRIQNDSNVHEQELKNVIEQLKNEIEMAKKKNAEAVEMLEKRKELDNMPQSVSSASSRAIPISGTPSKPVNGYLRAVPRSTVKTKLKAIEGIRSFGQGPIILDKPDAVRAKPDFSVATRNSNAPPSQEPETEALQPNLPTTLT